jgi:hypothetical protein
MSVFWEKVGAWGPIYRLVGQGLNDSDIAASLNLSEPRVRACITWILHFLGLTDRNALISQPQLGRRSDHGAESLGAKVLAEQFLASNFVGGLFSR